MGYGKTNQSPIQIDNPGLDQINQTINEQGQTLNTQGQTIASQGQSIQTNAANITTNTTNIASNAAQLADIAINIKNYGAKPNDNTFDNRTAIMNAIRDAASKGINAVFIPSGTWYISVTKPIYIPSNFTLYGVKGVSQLKAIQSTYAKSTLNNFNNYASNSLIALGDPTNEIIDTTGINVHDVYIDGIIVDGNVTNTLSVFSGDTNNYDNGFGMYLGYGYNISVTNCEVRNTLGTGVMFDRNYQSVINNCKVHNCGNFGLSGTSRNGISMTGSSTYTNKANTVSNNMIYNNGDIGLQFAYTNTNIVNNQIFNNATFGIEGDTSYSTSDSDQNNRGDCIIANNYLYNNGQIGITIGNANNQKIIINDNIIRFHSQQAISVSQTNGSVVNIHHNAITEINNSTNTLSMIYVKALKVIVESNQIYDCLSSSSPGIQIDIAETILISKNQIEDCQLSLGISVRGTRIDILNNTMKSKDNVNAFISKGISIYGTSPETLKIDGNHFRGIYRESVIMNPPNGNVRKIDISHNNFVNSTQGSVYVLNINASASGGTVNVLTLLDNYCNKDDTTQTFGRFLDVGTNYTVANFMTANNFVLTALSSYGTNLKCETTPTIIKQSNDVV